MLIWNLLLISFLILQITDNRTKNQEQRLFSANLELTAFFILQITDNRQQNQEPRTKNKEQRLFSANLKFTTFFIPHTSYLILPTSSLIPCKTKISCQNLQTAKDYLLSLNQLSIINENHVFKHPSIIFRNPDICTIKKIRVYRFWGYALSLT